MKKANSINCINSATSIKGVASAIVVYGKAVEQSIGAVLFAAAARVQALRAKSKAEPTDAERDAFREACRGVHPTYASFASRLAFCEVEEWNRAIKGTKSLTAAYERLPKREGAASKPSATGVKIAKSKRAEIANAIARIIGEDVTY